MSSKEEFQTVKLFEKFSTYLATNILLTNEWTFENFIIVALQIE